MTRIISIKEDEKDISIIFEKFHLKYRDAKTSINFSFNFYSELKEELKFIFMSRMEKEFDDAWNDRKKI